jgi:hypothetical protein
MPQNYAKALARLENNIRSGRFANYTKQKKTQIWNRLCRYARQLGIQIKAPVAAVFLAAGLCLSTPTKAQISFTLQSGAANPFNAIAPGLRSKPCFVDIDGDGDKDVFIGLYDGTIKYYKNTGTAASAVFTLQSGTANPLNGVDVFVNSAPSFVDIDADGDKDAFIGDFYGRIRYYKNTGTAIAPVLSLQTGTLNPFNAVDLPYYANPSFVDIDGDGDMDAIIGEYYGTINYYKNTGTAAAAIFTAQTGAANPFTGVNIQWAAPSFINIDADGDMDALIGTNSGTIKHYKNTGTAAAPVFAVQTGVANPFNGVNVGIASGPSLVDIDGDGDMDVFIGSEAGNILYYKNTSSLLPLQLLGFNGSKKAGFNNLQWQTSSEINTKQFELEASSNGIQFTKIATINAAGSGDNNYSYNDNAVYSGKVYYRLKIADDNLRFTYSQVIWINSLQSTVISIYPNPATDVVNINIGSSKLLKTNAVLFDAAGKLLQHIFITANQLQINVQALPKGVYTLKFADGTAQSFIKE